MSASEPVPMPAGRVNVGGGVTTRLRSCAWYLLAALLILLAVRMTAPESMRRTITEKAAQIATAGKPAAAELPVVIGPAFTATCAGLTLLLAAGAMACAFLAGKMRAGRMLRLALIAIILALVFISTCHAEDRFTALIGALDVAAALAAGITVAMLCLVLGDAGRRAVIAALIALLALWCAKGIYQYTVEIPNLIALYHHNPTAILNAQGLHSETVIKLFESRLNSREITAFFALSNVTAAAFTGLLVLLGGLLAAPLIGYRTTPGGAASTGDELAKRFILLAVGIIFLAIGCFLLVRTDSNGGIAMTAAGLVVVLAGNLLGRFVARHRRLVIGLAILTYLAGIGAVVGYGLRHQSLPSKSLLFRWEYWTGAAKIIPHHPWLGVGLNNFGAHYLGVKSPAAPEDVKDPHSYFVRFAVECGLPAAGAIALLLLWTLLAGARKPADPDDPTEKHRPAMLNYLIAGVACTFVWAVLYSVFTDVNRSLPLTELLGITGLIGWCLAVALCDDLSARRIRAIALAALIGAGGMFVYDQINMALVTGPVAMLFWMLLGLADSYELAQRRMPTSPSSALTTRKVLPAAIVAIPTALAGLATIVFVAYPIAAKTMPWDPAPFEYRYIEQEQTGHLPAAEAELRQALARNPRSLELLNQLVAVRRALHEPVTAAIERIMSIDDSNASVRVQLALPDTDLPAAERIRLLRQALAFNQQLAPDEPKRLDPAVITQIKAKIASLSAATAK